MNKQYQVTVVPAENKTNKFKSFFKRDKKAPTVLSERDARVLARVKSRAKLLDTGLNIGCARVGIDPIIGLVPVAGDLVTMLLALQLIYMAQEAEIPKSLSYRMLLNVVFDFGIGLVPILGDYADFLFKANARNAKHFEEFLYERAAKDEAKLEATTFAENNVTAPQSAAGPIHIIIVEVMRLRNELYKNDPFFTMSKDVRRLFAAQKAAKAASSNSSGSPSLSSAAKRVTHPLAKYDPKTFRLTCAICGPGVPIKSDSLWNAHLVSKAHQEAVAKLRAVKEQVQKREAEAAERLRIQQQQQQQAQAQGVKRKAPSALVAYAEGSDSESDDDEAPTTKQALPISDSKRLKVQDEEQDQNQDVADIEDEEDTMAGLPAGFFDSSTVNADNLNESSTKDSQQATQVEEEEEMSGVLPAGFFDDPEQDAKIRAEVGGATADLQQRQIDEEFKALQAELALDLERQEQQQKESALRPGQVSGSSANQTTAIEGTQAINEHIPYEEKVELEEQELEESILARSEEEYQLFVEMLEKLDALREKKNRLLVNQRPSSTTTSSLTSASKPVSLEANSKPVKKKNKSMLDIVREQEKAKKEKERLAAARFAKLSGASYGDVNMASDDEQSDEDDEDIEAMMDWRAKRV
ncbi:hypothetical protein BGZ49_000985 [Haplosporangium sp. Z 27]|nr:hypothetical protein BGZ49_000985 [Haplosporangium sp. Z 27]